MLQDAEDHEPLCHRVLVWLSLAEIYVASLVIGLLCLKQSNERFAGKLDAVKLQARRMDVEF